ncbi:MAG: autotransporter outer membrane beta-barrel domain-containing protein, partial [Alphaproteobacteria bacterium]
ASRGAAYGGVDASAFLVNPLRFAMAGSSDGARVARALAANAEKGRVASDAAPTGTGGGKQAAPLRWSTFIAADILKGDADGINTNFDITDFVVSAGVDYKYNDTFLAGLSVSFGNASTDAATREHNADMWGFDLYGSVNGGPFYLDSYLGVHWFDFSGNRPVVIDQVMNARADTNGFAFIAGVDAGALLDIGPLAVGPLFQLRHTSLKIDGFTETGVGDFGAAFPTRKPDQTLIGIGGQAQLVIKGKGKKRWTKLYTSVTYQNDVAKTGGRFFAQAGFASDPNFRFDVPGVAIDDEFGTVEVGLTSRLSNRWSFNVSFDTDFSRRGVDERRAALGLRYRF